MCKQVVVWDWLTGCSLLTPSLVHITHFIDKKTKDQKDDSIYVAIQ